MKDLPWSGSSTKQVDVKNKLFLWKFVCAVLLPVMFGFQPKALCANLLPRRIKSTLTAPSLETAPNIDGKITAAEWSKAQPLNEFAYTKGIKFQTRAWVGRDKNNFYFAARCFDDSLDSLVTKNKGNAIWLNDCIELFIVPDKKELFFAHLILSCDGKTSTTTWVPDEWGEPTWGKNIALKYAVGREDNAWTMELAVPIKAFACKLTTKSVWALGFNREKHSIPGEISSFQGGFNKPAQYPDWVFDNRTIVVDGIGLKNIGKQPQKIKVILQSEKHSKQSKEISLVLPPGKTRKLPWQTVTTGLKKDNNFSIIVLDAAGDEIVQETYKLIPGVRKTGPVDLKTIPAAKFVKSVLDDPGFFPIAVWLQPANQAERFKRMGVNLFIGGIDSYYRPKGKVWMDEIHKYDHYTIIPFKQKYIEQGLNQHPAFLGWMFGDEPDNVNPATGKVKHTPEDLLADFANIRSIDPAHPIYLNLGCGVANERFLGRAASDKQYAQYPKACDILSFDVYPCNSIAPNGPDRLHLIAKGIDRLRSWSNSQKGIWAWIEVNHFNKNNKGRAPTPEEVKTEIWMALIHGATGYGFFCHSWSKKFLKEKLGSKKSFSSTAIDSDMEKSLTNINREVKELAPVLNSPTRKGRVSIKTRGSRVDILVKDYQGSLYIFAVNMYRKPAAVEISLASIENNKVRVLNEKRDMTIVNGKFRDNFAPYAVHFYKVK